FFSSDSVTCEQNEWKFVSPGFSPTQAEVETGLGTPLKIACLVVRAGATTAQPITTVPTTTQSTTTVPTTSQPTTTVSTTTQPTTTVPTTTQPTTTVPTTPGCEIPCVHTVVSGAQLSSTCIDGNAVITCVTGRVGCKSDKGIMVSFDRATCTSGRWFGTTCDGEVHVPEVSPIFDCVVHTTTVPTTTAPITGLPTTSGPTTTGPTTTGPTSTGPTNTGLTTTSSTTTGPTTTGPT
ncbi:hypothetical protein PFISCL1PPCAC_4879, partial [Pristionchus fissidentatus]